MTYRSGSSSRVSGEWPPSRRSHLELAVVPAAVRTARQWTAQQLVNSGGGSAVVDNDLIDSAVLAVSELVTNAIAAVTSGLADSGFLNPAYAADGAAATAGAGTTPPGQLLSFGRQHNGAGVHGSLVTSAVIARSRGTRPALPTAPATAPPAEPPLAVPRVWLVIDHLGGLVRIEVHDSSRDPLPPPGHGDTEAETGRGLMVVAALAKSWGWEPEPTGKMVWCELAG